MATPGRPAPPKPWERAQSTNSGPSPFTPSSPTTSTAAAVATSDSNSGDDKAVVSGSNFRTVPVADGTQARQMPLRPWERTQGQAYGNPGYGTMSSYNRPFGGAYTGGYGYGGGYSSGYGSGYGGAYSGYNTGYSPYGGGMNYGGGYGGMYGRPSYMGPLGYGAPANPNSIGEGGGPPRPPNFWQSMLSVLHGSLNFFGRIAMLIDENTQAFHFFITALLQLCDRAGVLYGELARFVLRLLGFRARSKRGRPPFVKGAEEAKAIEVSAARGDNAAAGWDTVWGDR